MSGSSGYDYQEDILKTNNNQNQNPHTCIFKTKPPNSTKLNYIDEGISDEDFDEKEIEAEMNDMNHFYEFQPTYFELNTGNNNLNTNITDEYFEEIEPRFLPYDHEERLLEASLDLEFNKTNENSFFPNNIISDTQWSIQVPETEPYSPQFVQNFGILTCEVPSNHISPASMKSTSYLGLPEKNVRFSDDVKLDTSQIILAAGGSSTSKPNGELSMCPEIINGLLIPYSKYSGEVWKGGIQQNIIAAVPDEFNSTICHNEVKESVLKNENSLEEVLEIKKDFLNSYSSTSGLCEAIEPSSSIIKSIDVLAKEDGVEKTLSNTAQINSEKIFKSFEEVQQDYELSHKQKYTNTSCWNFLYPFRGNSGSKKQKKNGSNSGQPPSSK